MGWNSARWNNLEKQCVRKSINNTCLNSCHFSECSAIVCGRTWSAFTRRKLIGGCACWSIIVIIIRNDSLHCRSLEWDRVFIRIYRFDGNRPQHQSIMHLCCAANHSEWYSTYALAVRAAATLHQQMNVTGLVRMFNEPLDSRAHRMATIHANKEVLIALA